MGDVAIRAENLSKLYRIGEYRGGYETLREKIANTFSSSFRYLCRNPQSKIRNPQSETIWALKDISFEVRHGEVVGIIGRNGAGKTTLLKILSRITEPTEGWTEIRGRVGSLLEVGTGFHPELTGRENIYLNGAILGMKKAEIDCKFDEIVDFAEIEKFIDTPVKRYSSGMYVRLAFAVAAHMEPEILLVDEVLAVGDVAFQKKCLGKMDDVAKEGRTVLFVSHNMEAVQKLCDRCILLQNGNISEEGTTHKVVSKYLKKIHKNTTTKYYKLPDSNERGKTSLIEALVLNSYNNSAESILFGEPFSIRMLWKHWANISGAAYTIRVYDQHDRFLFAANTINSNLNIGKKGLHDVTCYFPTNVLPPGEYRASVGCYIRPHTTLEEIDNCLKLVILSVPYRNDFLFSIVGGPLVALRHYWNKNL